MRKRSRSPKRWSGGPGNACDPQRVQAAGGGRFPDRGGLPSRGAGKIDPARASLDAPSVVGAAAACVLAGGVDGASAAGPVRRALPAVLQGRRPTDSSRDGRAAAWVVGGHRDGRGAAAGHPEVHRRLRQLGQRRQRRLPRYGRALVKAAHGEEPPLVVDPFAGGGSIPLGGAAPRLRRLRQRPQPGGLPDPQGDAGGHPPPRAASWPRNCARPAPRSSAAPSGNWPTSIQSDPDGATPGRLSWARTVRCEAPNCGAEIPIYMTVVLAVEKEASRARFFSEKEDAAMPRSELTR